MKTDKKFQGEYINANKKFLHRSDKLRYNPIDDEYKFGNGIDEYDSDAQMSEYSGQLNIYPHASD